MTYRTDRNRAFALTPFARAGVKYAALTAVLFLTLGGLTTMTHELAFPIWLRFGIYVFGGLSIIGVYAVLASRITDTYHEEINQ